MTLPAWLAGWSLYGYLYTRVERVAVYTSRVFFVCVDAVRRLRRRRRRLILSI